MSTVPAVFTQSLFQVYVAAALWLREHPEDPNAESVRQSLKDLNTVATGVPE